MVKKQVEKSLQTKKELMEAAIKLFGKRGFTATTVAEIAGEAGYAKGNFYRYWKSKDDIFLDIMEIRLKTYRKIRENGLKKAKSIEDVMEEVIEFLENILDDRNWSKVFLEFTIHGFGNPELKQKLNKSNYRLSTDLFAEILKPFHKDVVKTKKLGALITALFEGYLIQEALETNVLHKKDLREAITILFNHFLKRS